MSGNKVGYCNPPKETQFKKGQSGNPAGRRRKQDLEKSVGRLLQEWFLEKVKVQINGKARKMTRLEALAAAQFTAGMKGSTTSARWLFSLAEKYAPPRKTLQELMDGRPVFEFTEEEARRFSKDKLVEGFVFTEDEISARTGEPSNSDDTGSDESRSPG